MFRRTFCLFCTVLLLFQAFPAFSETSSGNGSYDFDLTFHLNDSSFPELLRSRAAGYASLINRLGLRGNLSWSNSTQSMDLDAVLYYTDKPSLSYPFRLYGTRSRVFITSPLINNEIILLNMAALMEFAMKAKSTLGLSLNYPALLIPYTTESAFEGIVQAWQDAVGTFTESGEISDEQFRKLSRLWADELQNNGRLRWWITGLSTGCDYPYTVEAEMENLPEYYKQVTGGQSVSVSVTPGSEIWRNASGDTLFSRQESDHDCSLVLSLPASENGYVPCFSYAFRHDDRTCSFEISGSLSRDASAVVSSSEESADEYADDEGYDQEENYDPYGEDQYDPYGGEEAYPSYDEDSYDASWDEYEAEEAYGEYDEDSESENGYGEDLPELLLSLFAAGDGLPAALPADSMFSLTVSILGVLYPNYSFHINGETNRDGGVSLSLCKPGSNDAAPEEILRCSGTIRPASEPKDVPDYQLNTLDGVYNVFSFNEQKISRFTDNVVSPLVRGIISFVAAAPTASGQSFLDDLTDIGLLDMLLD